MSETEHRFDVTYRGNDVSIDYHFCRTWDGDRGCHGTNPDHGLSFDDARREVANYYRGLTAMWDAITYEKWSEEPALALNADDGGDHERG